jgi:PKD domain
MVSRWVAMFGASFMVACGGSPTSPTAAPAATAAQPAVVPVAPVARLGVSIDGGQSVVAIQAASTVTFDATGSSGTGLRFGIDYGDGQGSDQPVGTHTYQLDKTYHARVIVTDSSGRTDSAAADVVVHTLVGQWDNFIYDPWKHIYESRRLTITGQTGRVITGIHSNSSGHTSGLTGEVTSDRGITLRLTDGTVSFSSEPPDGIDSQVTAFSVLVKGGSADAKTLSFSKYPY